MRKFVLGAAFLTSALAATMALPVSAEYSRFQQNELTPAAGRQLVAMVMSEASDEIRALRDAYFQQCEQQRMSDASQSSHLSCSDEADEKMVSLLSTAVGRAYSAGASDNESNRTRGW
ncbi:hypothetical protein ACWJJH_04255 [Endozoicomonadaceae bacterium StTr2]